MQPGWFQWLLGGGGLACGGWPPFPFCCPPWIITLESKNKNKYIISKVVIWEGFLRLYSERFIPFCCPMAKKLLPGKGCSRIGMPLSVRLVLASLQKERGVNLGGFGMGRGKWLRKPAQRDSSGGGGRQKSKVAVWEGGPEMEKSGYIGQFRTSRNPKVVLGIIGWQGSFEGWV